MDEVQALCELTNSLGVDGMLISPGYPTSRCESEIFLTREEINRKFAEILSFSKKYKLTSTPMFLEFAAGRRDYRCSPWSTVTYTPRGWKRPCYLIGQEYTNDWDEFWNETDWDYWESRQDPLLPELRHALRLRGFGRRRGAQAPDGHGATGRLEPDRLGESVRTFVTGASGFVGNHLARALRERGDQVRCLVRESSPQDLFDGLDVERVVGDLRDVESLRARHPRLRRGLPLRGGLPALRARPAGDVRLQRRGDAQRPARLRRVRRRARCLHQHRRRAGPQRRRNSRRRADAGRFRRHGRPLQEEQVPGRARRRGVGRQGAPRRHRQPVHAGRRRRREAHGDGQDDRRLPQRQGARLRRHRVEPRRCPRRRGGPPAGCRARAGPAGSTSWATAT